MFVTFKGVLAHEADATAIEYGLICAFIAVAILTALKVVGTELIASLTLLLGAVG